MRCLHILALLAVCSIGALSESVIDKGDYLIVCKSAFDLGIIFDVSMSIHEDDFETVKQSLVEFLKKFSIGPKTVRVGLIPFENDIHINHGFTLNQYHTSDAVVSHVTNLPHIGKMMNRGGGAMTETRKALEYVRTTLLSPAVAREGIPRLCLVMTDGNSQKKELTKSQAAALRATNVTVYAVGFGNYIKEEELINIAGDRSRIMLEKDFSNMESSMMSLASAVCKKMPKPPNNQCLQTDVHFVFSRVELGAALSLKAVGLVKTLSRKRKFRTGYKWAVASGVCTEDAGFGLAADITKKLEYYYEAHFTAIVNTMQHRSIYSGNNESICNVAVLVVNKFGLDNLQENVATLKHAGLEHVIIWNLSGSDITVRNAIVVNTGENVRRAANAIGLELDTE